MCRHVLNAQVSIRFPDGNWYDCPECYLDETRAGGAHESAPLALIGPIITFACHNCKNPFKKDMNIFDDVDESCPHCKAPYVIPAMTPEGCIADEGMSFIEEALHAQVVVWLGAHASSHPLLPSRARCRERARRARGGGGASRACVSVEFGSCRR
jgi:hypothetical protein